MSDIHALSGAYAVDAVDDIERASFERHLASCPTCRAEVASLRETSALLADAATTGLALVAQVMLNRKWLGTWWVWIVTDIALVALFASQGLWLTAVLYAGFTALCVQGLRRWGRELARVDDAPAPVPVRSAA